MRYDTIRIKDRISLIRSSRPHLTASSTEFYLVLDIRLYQTLRREDFLSDHFGLGGSVTNAHFISVTRLARVKRVSSF